METYPFHDRDIVQKAPKESGVYAIVYRASGACIYVGQAVNLRRRLREELSNPDEKLGRWIKYYGPGLEFCYRTISRTGIIRKVEKALIRRWTPDANIQHNR